MLNLVLTVKKNGSIIAFDSEKIKNDITRAVELLGGSDTARVEFITNKIVDYLIEKYKDEAPTSDDISKAVIKTLFENGHGKTAQAFSLYRDLRNRVKDIHSLIDSDDLMDNYLRQLDWRVKENSNMAFSLQGLNNHVSSAVSTKYWLNKIYTKEIREAHMGADFHIHDLQVASSYCCGWDMKDLLVRGFGGVRGKITSRPAKHFRAALGQIVNFIYTVQGEVAGAQAMNSFDTYLAPFIRFDSLSYKEAKQAVQEFLFNMNVPCYDDKTEILTRNGFKLFRDLDKNDEVMTLSKKNTIEYQKPVHIVKYPYTGNLIHIKTSRLNLKVTPNHWMLISRQNGYRRETLTVRADSLKYNDKIPKTGKWSKKEKQFFILPELIETKSFYSPFSNDYHKREKKWKKKKIKMDAWLSFIGIYLAEGYAVNKDTLKAKTSNYEVGIVNKTKKAEIRKILKYLPFKFREDEDRFITLDKQLWSYLVKLGNCYSKYIPREFKELSSRQLKILLGAFGLGDGHKDGDRFRFYCTSSKSLQNDIGELIIKIGHSPRYLKMKFKGTKKIGDRIIHPSKDYPHFRIYENISKYYTFNDYRGRNGFTNFKQVSYKGFVYCVEVPNHIIMVRREGTCVWSGNTRVGFQSPFSNLSFDLIPPRLLGEEKVIIGGQEQNETYSDFQDEIDLINKVFAELMLEGDGSGQVFSFPIPTYNITNDFKWDNPVLDPIWEMTAKFGVPYFANFVSSDMNPDDIRSMCLHPSEKIIVRINDIIRRTTIGELMRNSKFDHEGWSEPKEKIEVLSLNPINYKIEWKNVLSFLRKYDNKLITITTNDGKSIKVSKDHLISIYTPRGIEIKPAKEINLNDILLTTRSADSCLNTKNQKIGKYDIDESFAFLIGFFIADGNYLYDSRKIFKSYKKERGMQFTFHSEDIEAIEKIKNIIKDKFGYNLRIKKDPRYENSSLSYIWSTEISRELSNNGLRKYGGVPEVIFNCPKNIIISFLDGFFAGDLYDKGKEIHINDKDLIEDLAILYTLIGIPTTISYRSNSQILRIQHIKGRGSKQGLILNDILYNRVPQFIVQTSRAQPFYNKNNLVCLSSIRGHSAHTEESKKILSSDLALLKIRSIIVEDLKKEQDFYDLELDDNHLFMHSLGNITHNCCRLRIDKRELKKRGGGLFASNPKTGSLGVVTLNMARIGFLSKTPEDFFLRIERLMMLAKESLELKRQAVEKFTEAGLYPYSKFYMEDVKRNYGGYWKNHFNTIGLLGMNEALLNFMGKNIASAEGIKFAEEVLDFMLNKLKDFQEQTGNIYNLEATPGEGATYRFAKSDKMMYPNIITSGEKYPFYTNSTQLPVNHTTDIFEALRLQESLQIKYTGGCVFHGFLGERIEADACKNLVRKVMSNSRIPYFTVSPTFSICPDHGYLSGEREKCDCGKSCEVFSRIVGYLRPVENWNLGKQEEFRKRTPFKVN